jgi:hypothetical protein
VDRLSFAAYDAKGFKSVRDAMAAQVALAGFISLVIEFYGTVRAGFQTGPATIAQFYIENHDAAVQYK